MSDLLRALGKTARTILVVCAGFMLGPGLVFLAAAAANSVRDVVAVVLLLSLSVLLFSVASSHDAANWRLGRGQSAD